MSTARKQFAHIVSLSLAFMPAFSAVAAPLGDAAHVLGFYGRSNGLCAVIAAADEIPVSLLRDIAGNGMAVHVIALQEGARARLAASLTPADRSITVERIAAPPLPYSDNLVNLIVVDDLASAGIDRTELDRVVAPAGVIALNTSGGWELSRKAWPAGMDEWTHPNYDATGNRYSKDEYIKPPFTYKWIDGIGVPLFGAGAKSWVICNGRCFSVSASQPENLGLKIARGESSPQYLEARDAFNGLVLWKQPVGQTQSRRALSWRNVQPWRNSEPLVAAKDTVCAVRNGKLVAFNAADGREMFVCDNTTAPWALRLSRGTLVTAGREESGITISGAIEAFDAATGGRRWALPVIAQDILASDDTLFVLTRDSATAPTAISGYDLAGGTKRFSVADNELGGGTLRLLSAGKGYLLANRGAGIVALSEADGRMLWQIDSTPCFWGPVIDGQFWNDTTAYDVVSGTPVKTIPAFLMSESLRALPQGNDFGCYAIAMVKDLLIANRHSRFQQVVGDKVKLYFFRGLRGGCAEGMVPAEGMLFTGPRDCRCVPTHPYGFAVIAPVDSDPAADEFTAQRDAEKGEAFGSLAAAPPPVDGWTTYRGNAERSASSEHVAGFAYRPRWSARIIEKGAGLVEDSYSARCQTRISPPVCGNGKVFVAVAEPGEVVAMDERTGAVAWRRRAGSRVVTSPSIFRNGCFFGCNDGYVYAVSADDGRLMWRVRIAPRERRIMDHGMLESPWPVFGSVLVYNDTIYASAGRNSEADGGVVIVALDPATGARKWARYIDVVLRSKNDLLSIADGKLVWQKVTLDPRTGEGDLVEARVKSIGNNRSGMWDSMNLASGSQKRLGDIHSLEGRSGWLMAWNDRYLVGGGDGDVCLRKALSNETAAADSVDGSPVALAVCPNAFVAGYDSAEPRDKRLSVRTFDSPVTYDFSLDSGVIHNGIAVMKDALALSLEDGTVTVLGRVPLPAHNAGFVLRVNCGGVKPYTDSKGRVWSPDQAYTPGKWGAVGGGMYDRTKDLGVVGDGGARKRVSSPDEPLYLSEHSAMTAYRFTVPNGRYAVTLHIAETYFGPDMVLPNGDLSWQHRRFDVRLNGDKVLDNFEPIAAAGGESHVPVIRRFETEAGNGEITIRFSPRELNSVINAIEIEGLSDEKQQAQTAPIALR